MSEYGPLIDRKLLCQYLLVARRKIFPPWEAIDIIKKIKQTTRWQSDRRISEDYAENFLVLKHSVARWSEDWERRGAQTNKLKLDPNLPNFACSQYTRRLLKLDMVVSSVCSFRSSQQECHTTFKLATLWRGWRHPQILISCRLIERRMRIVHHQKESLKVAAFSKHYEEWSLKSLQLDLWYSSEALESRD